jgi:hypothetical protein
MNSINCWCRRTTAVFSSYMNSRAKISSSLSIATIRRTPCERDGRTIVVAAS